VTASPISDLTIIFSAVSLAICIILPIVGIIFCRIKYKMPLYPILFGALTFLLFYMFFETVARDYLESVLPILKNPVVYTFYSALMAGIFEETGRLISFTIIERISKKPQTARTGISYGFGHGGCEAFLFVTVAMLANVIFGITHNNGALYEVIGTYPMYIQRQAMLGVIQMQVSESWLFLMAGIDQIISFALQLALSVIMFYAVFGKRKIWLFPVAIIIHMIAKLPAGFISNTVTAECVSAFAAAAVIVFAAWVHDKYKDTLAAYTPVAANTGDSVTLSETDESAQANAAVDTGAAVDTADESEK
jgi:uncharacterized membrane protein YhfC